MPELKVPPRLASICPITSASSTGSNGVTVLATSMPPAVTNLVSPRGGWAPKSAL